MWRGDQVTCSATDGQAQLSACMHQQLAMYAALVNKIEIEIAPAPSSRR
jgi:hypothetical protein